MLVGHEMDILANELSLHGQFADVSSFRKALDRMMEMRIVAERYGFVVSCNSAVANRHPVRGLDMRQLLNRIPEGQRRGMIRWITRQGPFWDVHRIHPESEWLECRGCLVTGTSIGEAAFRTIRGIKCGLVSFSPSEWQDSPIQFVWKPTNDESEQIHGSIENWHTVPDLESSLKRLVPEMISWTHLKNISARRFTSLAFSPICFDGLIGVPFRRSSADQILSLLEVLHRLAIGFSDDGIRTLEAQQLYDNHFTGYRAWFSDSSDSEKQKFKEKLTFKDPRNPNRKAIFGWHGKESHSSIRLHFSWPIRHRESIAVVYIGPKLTKK